MRVAAINLVVADQPTAATNPSTDWEYTDNEGALHDFIVQVRQMGWVQKAELLGLQICDTAGQEAMKSLRTMSYPETDIFLVA